MNSSICKAFSLWVCKQASFNVFTFKYNTLPIRQPSIFSMGKNVLSNYGSFHSGPFYHLKYLISLPRTIKSITVLHSDCSVYL